MTDTDTNQASASTAQMDVKTSFQRASELMERGEFATALSFLSHVLKVAQQSEDDHDLMIAVLSTRAYCHTMIGRLSSAEEDFNRVIDDSSQDDPIVAPTLIARGVLNRILGRPKATRDDIFAAQTLGIEDAQEEADSLYTEWIEVPAIRSVLVDHTVGAEEAAPVVRSGFTGRAASLLAVDPSSPPLQTDLTEQNEQLAIENQNFELTIEEQQYRLVELAASASRLEEAVAAKTAEAKLAHANWARSEESLEERLRHIASAEQQARAQALEKAALLEQTQTEAAQAMEKLQDDANRLRQRESAADSAREMEQEHRIRAQKQKKALEEHLRELEEQMSEQEKQVHQAVARAEEQGLLAHEHKQRAQAERDKVARLQLQLAEMEDRMQHAISDFPSRQAHQEVQSVHTSRGGTTLADDIDDSAVITRDQAQHLRSLLKQALVTPQSPPLSSLKTVGEGTGQNSSLVHQPREAHCVAASSTKGSSSHESGTTTRSLHQKYGKSELESRASSKQRPNRNPRRSGKRTNKAAKNSMTAERTVSLGGSPGGEKTSVSKATTSPRTPSSEGAEVTVRPAWTGPQTRADGTPSQKLRREAVSLEYAPNSKIFMDIRSNENCRYLKVSQVTPGQTRQNIQLPEEMWTALIEFFDSQSSDEQ